MITGPLPPEEAQRSAARAQIYQSRPGELYTSTLLAIDSMRREPSDEAEEILRRNIRLLFQRQINHTGDSRHRGLYLVRKQAQLAKIVAEDLHRHVSERAREHMIDAMGNRLAKAHIRPRQHTDLFADLLKHFRFGTSAHL